jgi:osmotically-inducible protein OsmY
MRSYLISAFFAAIASLFATGLAAPPASAGLLGDVLMAPKTLIDRAIEARSAEDIYKDNEIVIKVNAVMADLGTIKASTEIYEQRLLVTGLFDDIETYEKFLAGVKNVEGIKELYWHVQYMSEEDQEARKDEMLDWVDALELDTRVGISLVETAGVADVNFRVAVDAFSNVYLIGRARSEEEMRKAVQVSSETKGAGVIINYVEVRP